MVLFVRIQMRAAKKTPVSRSKLTLEADRNIHPLQSLEFTAYLGS
jgi:hypothetical protein